MIYLNNAATSWPKAPGVAEAVLRALREPVVEAGRASGAGEDPLAECRGRVARLLGVEDGGSIVFTQNATAALNLALSGLPMPEGALVVTSVTEHNSLLRPLERLSRQGKLRYEAVGIEPGGTLQEEAYERALAQRPALVALNHASNVTGRILPVGDYFARAKACGALTLLDASQSLGWTPVRARDLRADLVAFTGHKALHGPAGTGGLYVSPEVRLEPLWVGGTGTQSQSLEQPEAMPARLEAGTPNLAGLAGLSAALDWHRRGGAEAARKGLAAAAQLRRELGRIAGVRLFPAEADGPATGVVSFRLKGWAVEELGFALARSFGVACRAGLHCAPLMHAAMGSAPDGTIRFSTSGFTSDKEVEEAIQAVGRLARCGS